MANKNKPLSKEEQEVEEMTKEVKDAGFYYKDMELDELKTAALKLRESSTKNNEKTTSSPSVNKCQIIQNSAETSENILDKITTNSSGKNSLNDDHSTAVATFYNKQSNLNDKNSESVSTVLSVTNIKNKAKGIREIVFEKSSILKKEEYPEFGSKVNPKSTTNDRNKTPCKKNKNLRSSSLTKLERWKLNPNNFTVVNDTPLESLESVCAHQEDSFFSEEELDLDDNETFNKLCQQMNAQLDALSEKYSIQEEKKSQWGSLYKAPKTWNDSLDLNASTKKNKFHTNPNPDTSIRQSLDRATKRKALSSICAATYKGSSDENSDSEFIDTKKKKRPQNKKVEEVSKKDQETQSDTSTPIAPVEIIDVDDNAQLSDMEIFDTPASPPLHKNSLKKNLMEVKSITEEEIIYPRRIVPPNPTKMKSIRGKKKYIPQNQNSFLKPNSLNDEEINKTINELNEEIDGRDHINIVNEIKPLSVPKSVQRKLQLASIHLENIRFTQEQKQKSEDEIKKQKEKDDEIKRDELISKRLQEDLDECNRKTEREKKLNEKTVFYNTKLNTPNRRVTRSNFNKPIKNTETMEEMNEDYLLDADNDESITSRTDTSVQNCPICQKSFPDDQIISHASGCMEFFPESDELINQPSSSYSTRPYHECHICNNYKTYDGNKYEEHVIICKRNAEDRRNGIYIGK